MMSNYEKVQENTGLRYSSTASDVPEDIASKQILLVDDDLDFVKAIKDILESEPSYKVITAYDGEEAMERIEQETPDLIILDIMMPRKHGYELCSELKNHPEFSDIPIILLTGVRKDMSKTRYTVQMGKMTQADDYVEKPVEPSQLLDKVEHLLDIHREEASTTPTDS